MHGSGLRSSGRVLIRHGCSVLKYWLEILVSSSAQI